MAEIPPVRKKCDTNCNAVLADQVECSGLICLVDVKEGDLISIVDCDKLVKNRKRGEGLHYAARVLEVLENGKIRVQWVGYERVKGYEPFSIQPEDLRVITTKSNC